MHIRRSSKLNGSHRGHGGHGGTTPFSSVSPVNSVRDSVWIAGRMHAPISRNGITVSVDLDVHSVNGPNSHGSRGRSLQATGRGSYPHHLPAVTACRRRCGPVRSRRGSGRSRVTSLDGRGTTTVHEDVG